MLTGGETGLISTDWVLKNLLALPNLVETCFLGGGGFGPSQTSSHIRPVKSKQQPVFMGFKLDSDYKLD